jgi:copper(I)-binding protein
MVARIAIALASLAFAGVVHGEVTLKNAWMRPAPGGADAARAYVDIVSDTTLDLVGASTPVARSVEIVQVGTIGDPATEKVVKSLPVLAGTTTRLAYRGDHLRFVQMTRDVANGDPVPLTLMFRNKAGKRVEATTQVVVRGLLLPQQMPESARDAPMKTAPGPGAATPGR